jgi:hypothetical protein
MRKTRLRAAAAAAAISAICVLPALAGPPPASTNADIRAAAMTDDPSREAPRPVGWVLLVGGLSVAGASLLRRRKIRKAA